MDERGKLTDEELFTSPAYTAYQSDLAETATRRYQSGVQVRIVWDGSEEAHTAYTDNRTIHMNAADPLVASFPSRMLRSQCLVGLNGHECGHMLFTDFTSRKLYLASLAKGSFYPKEPDITLQQYRKNQTEILDAMAERKPAVCHTLAECAAHISNILEDIYIEARMCEKYPGSFKLGLELLNLRMEEQMPSVQYQIDHKYEDFSIMSNLLLQYCRAGDINNLTGYTGEYLDHLVDCVPFADDSMYETDPRTRFVAANHMLVVLWKYIKPLVDKAEEAEKNGQGEEFDKELEETLSGQVKSGAPMTSGKGRPKDKSKGKLPPSGMKDGRIEAQKAVAEETGRMEKARTAEIKHGSNPGVTYNPDYTGSGYEDAANDMLSIMTEVATQKTHGFYEEELREGLQQDAKEISYGNAHKGIHVRINRLVDVPPEYEQDYQKVAGELLPISKRLQKKMLQVLKDQKEGGKLHHLLYGKRLDARAVFREDGACFSRTRLPSEESRLAVGLLLDESGSMSSAHRITKARETAIVLHDFCTALGIPTVIYGHTESSCVELYSYAEFDSLDRKDRYRLMDMCARSGNRDGAALRFVAERLMTRQEEQKVLILVSDGQPAADGYYGTAAEMDLRGIKAEYRKKGIALFAAAIGDDKDQIRRIYGDGFLDITNLEELPKNLPQLISKYIA